MTSACRQCSSAFEITQEDLKFYDDVSPVICGKKHALPPPQLCPDCRFQRRLSFRNERFLYHRKSDLTGKQIVSMYAPDKPYKVYDQDEFWSDQWDECSYGRDFDFSKTFTEQFASLGRDAPHQALFTSNVENSYYTNHTLNMRNCYLLFGGGDSQDCMFGRFIIYSQDTLDGLSLYSCRWCYEGIASQDCYHCLHFQNCRNCSDCLMVEDCQGCKNCCLCFGLKGQEYCILNERLGKEEYEKRMAELRPLTPEKIQSLRARLTELKMRLPHRQSHIFGSEDCTGDMIFNSKNCKYSFDATDCEDCKYLCYTPKGIHSYDCTYNAPVGVRWVCEAGSTVGMENAFSTFLCWYGDNNYYSRECHSCSNIFGCISMRKKKYCILNKQYTQEAYEELVPRIIEHMRKDGNGGAMNRGEASGSWGEHFHQSLSYMGYNETVAQEQVPLTQQEAQKKGWSWYFGQEKKDAYLGPEVKVPAVIGEIPETICDQILRCEVTGKPFKIIPQELKFYRDMGIPLPRRCFDQRHLDRVALRSSRKLWKRNCMKCQKGIETTYQPSRPEIVYCENCYLKEVY
ncbi:MAG: hypothetical protein WC840_01720 [Candidatus Peribacteraceae bacterium]